MEEMKRKMQPLKTVFGCILGVLTVALGYLVINDVVSYGKTLTAMPLGYIIIGHLVFGLLSYAIVGLVYFLIRHWIRKAA
jgi:hypothetical protein